MKPIHIIILVLAFSLLVFAFLYNRKKMREAQKASKDKLINGAVAIATITTVVDPTTNEEFIISDLGENNLDGGPETRKMKANLATVINNINSRYGTPGIATFAARPNLTTLRLKMYDAKMNLLSSTTIANPHTQTLPIAVPAFAKQTNTGITYNCVGNAAANGPGFYNNGSDGNLFFGMFCK